MIQLIKLWGHTKRPWGYEIRAIFQEEGKKEDINVEMTFPKEPDEKEIAQAVALHTERIEKQLSEIPIVPIKDSYSKEEVQELITAFKVEISAKVASVPEAFKDIVAEVTKPVVKVVEPVEVKK